MTERSHLRLDCRDRAVRLQIDGRALLCLAGETVLARHPLHRLHRISLRGDVMVHVEALAALSGAGIPLAVLAGDGTTAALAPPRWRRPSSLGAELQRLTSPQAAPLVEDWRLAEISRHARALRLGDPAGAARAGWHAPELLLRASQPEATGATARRMVNEAISFCRLLGLRVLGDAGVPTCWLDGGASGHPDLCEAVAQIALWRLLRLVTPRRGRGTVAGALRQGRQGWQRNLATLAEGLRPALATALARDLHRFHLHLIDMRSDSAWHG